MTGKKKIVWGALLFLFLLPIFSGIITLIFEKEVKQKIIQYVNTYLTVPVEVEKIEMSVITSFPYASLRFHKVKIADLFSKADTFFFTKFFAAEINLWDLLRKRYVIRHLTIADGILKIKVNEEGQYNLHIIKDSPDKEISEVTMDVNKLLAENINFYFIRQKEHSVLRFFSEQTLLKGSFTNENYDMEADVTWTGCTYTEQNKQIIYLDRLAWEGVVSIRNKGEQILFTDLECIINQSFMKAKGSITGIPEGWRCNIDMEVAENKVEHLLNLFPENIRNIQEEYRIEGESSFSMRIRGNLTKEEIPEIMAYYSVVNASVTEPQSKVTFSDIYSHGQLVLQKSKKGFTFYLTSDTFHLSSFRGHIQGNFKMLDLYNPYLRFHLTGSIPVENLILFFQYDSVLSAAGTIEGMIGGDILLAWLHHKESRTQIWDNIKGNVSVMLSECRVIPHNFSLDTLLFRASLRGKSIFFDTLRVTTPASDISFVGYAHNLLSYMMDSRNKAELQGRLSSRRFDFNDWLIKSSEEKNTSTTLLFPPNFQVKGQIQMNQILWDQWKGEQLEATLYYRNQELQVSNASMRVFGGLFRGDFQVSQEGSVIYLQSRCKLDQVEMKRMFEECKNFGQSSLKSENIEGKATLQAGFSFQMDTLLNIALPSIKAQMEVSISQGRLRNYSPLYSLSSFIDVDELRDIRFSDIQTELTVNNRKVYFPKTFIRSSVLDIWMYGTHSFSNEIDYHFELYFSDLLWRKARARKKENEEFAVHEEKDNRRAKLFIRMYGTVEDVKFSYDRQGLREKWKNDFEQEKKTLKQIFKQEFSKSDTLKSKTWPTDFQMEWEEKSIAPDTLPLRAKEKNSIKIMGKEIRKNEKVKEEIELE